MEGREFVYKILLLGDATVGKTCFLMRYVDNTFQDSHMSTVGLDYKIKTLQMEDGKNVKIQIWDTAGQDRFRSITKNYYKGAHAIILIFDVTNHDSFDNVSVWINQIKEEVSEKVCIVLVGNKIDEVDKRKVLKEDGENIASEYKLDYFECSAKTGENIETVFQEVVKTMVENYTKIPEAGEKLSNEKKKKSNCCKS